MFSIIDCTKATYYRQWLLVNLNVGSSNKPWSIPRPSFFNVLLASMVRPTSRRFHCTISLLFFDMASMVLLRVLLPNSWPIQMLFFRWLQWFLFYWLLWHFLCFFGTVLLLQRIHISSNDCTIRILESIEIVRSNLSKVKTCEYLISYIQTNWYCTIVLILLLL